MPSQYAGERFERLIAETEELSGDTPDLDKQAGALRKDLDECIVSAPLKTDLRDRINKIQKKAADAKKKALAGRVDAVLSEVNVEIEKAASEGRKVLVLNVDIGADGKASQKVMNNVKSKAPGMAFLGVSEAEPGSGGKAMVFALVPNDLIEEGIKADEWVRSTLEVCGGRGGGKPTNAQGQAPECDDVGAVIDAAMSFADSKIGTPTV